MQIYSEPIIDFDNDFLHTMVLPDSGKEAGKWSFFFYVRFAKEYQLLLHLIMYYIFDIKLKFCIQRMELQNGWG